MMLMIGFGVAGYLMRKIDLDPAPLVLAFVLGNPGDQLSPGAIGGQGNASLFHTRPIAAGLLLCCVALIAFQLYQAMTQRARRLVRVRRTTLSSATTPACPIGCARTIVRHGRSRADRLATRPRRLDLGGRGRKPLAHRRAQRFSVSGGGGDLGGHRQARRLSAQAVSAARRDRRNLHPADRQRDPAASRLRYAACASPPASRSRRSSAS